MRAICALFASLHLLACVSQATEMSYENIEATFQFPHVNLDSLSRAFKAWELFNEHATAAQKKRIVTLIAALDIPKLDEDLDNFIKNRTSDDYGKYYAALYEHRTDGIDMYAMTLYHGNIWKYGVNIKKAQNRLLKQTLPGVDFDNSDVPFLKNFLNTDSTDRTEEVLAYLKAHRSQVPDILLSHVATQLPHLKKSALNDALDDFERRVIAGELTQHLHPTVPLIEMALFDPGVAKQALSRNPRLFRQPTFVGPIAILASNDRLTANSGSRNGRRRLVTPMIDILVNQIHRPATHPFENPEWLEDPKTQRQAFRLINRLEPENIPVSILIDALPTLEYPFNKTAVELLKRAPLTDNQAYSLGVARSIPKVDAALKRWYPKLSDNPFFLEAVAYAAAKDEAAKEDVERAMKWIDPRNIPDQVKFMLLGGFDKPALAKYLADPENKFVDHADFGLAAFNYPAHLSAEESEDLIRYLNNTFLMGESHRGIALESSSEFPEFRKGAVLGFSRKPLLPGLPEFANEKTPVDDIVDVLRDLALEEDGRPTGKGVPRNAQTSLMGETPEAPYVLEHVGRILTPDQIVAIRSKIADQPNWHGTLVKANLENPGMATERAAFIHEALKKGAPYEDLEFALRLIEKYPRLGVPHTRELVQLINFNPSTMQTHNRTVVVPSIHRLREKIYNSLLSDTSVSVATRHRFLGQLSRAAQGVWPKEIVSDLRKRHRLLRMAGPFSRVTQSVFRQLNELCQF